ncbi:hypothetical protein RJ639_010504 [Escallonia herrerae]|uniref:Uncharacterized protein n=1 Tax=Escallonia herrerae TaxID=1293975 RepID=A0AA89AU50_9ASTE|nr:hypothetical protein RJ639_010504 [Escallonia herrerae]
MWLSKLIPSRGCVFMLIWYVECRFQSSEDEPYHEDWRAKELSPTASFAVDAVSYDYSFTYELHPFVSTLNMTLTTLWLFFSVWKSPTDHNMEEELLRMLN